MKTLEKAQIETLITYYEDSAYAYQNEIAELAEEIFEEDEDEIEDVEASILSDVEQYLTGFEYIECEHQGSADRHIWHKIEE